MTQLEAINNILAFIGEAPLNDLSTAITSDAALAVRTLDEVSTKEQALGWKFNTEIDVPLNLANDGTCPVSADTLRAVVDPNRYCDVDPVLRGSKFYDRKNRTYTFAKPLIVKKLVTKLSFDLLPVSAQHYFVVKAARIFVDRVGGGQEVHGYSQQQEQDAKRDFQRDQAEDRDANILRAPGVVPILQRNSPWV